ncbi:S-adenosyl-L-methionine-dependent methyltransferase [Phascolomyces articulosus]|uniref:S-adenosyl-L-methionine-dependent methyltransferase n=1 Tax=Phascolomyces articulosus TaxID=60185 RepID=A0AAD5K0U4_9FUNG|nr:S-adenosyl-L-methionine-dependent methyltransferase [Phascolomyces articulosus]
MNTVKYINHKPFLAYFTNLLESRNFTQPIRLLEAGCGPGHFAALLKDQLKDRIDIIAIDPSEEGIKACANHNADVNYLVTTILDMDKEKYANYFDVILFTKSLHHCDPLDATIDQTYKFLKKNGIVVAEEFDRDAIDEQTARWFFERLDLIQAGNHIKPPTLKNESLLKRWTALIDPATGSPMDRWNSFFDVRGFEGLFKHGLQGDRMSVHSAMTQSLAKRFSKNEDQESMVVKAVHNQSFLTCSIVFFGLEDTPIGTAILETFMKQEEVAIKDGTIKGTGVTYIVEKQED